MVLCVPPIGCSGSSFSDPEWFENVLPKIGVTRVSDVTGLDRIGVPVFQATRPNARSLSVSQGKGLSPEQAAISAIMEAAESFHCESINLKMTVGSYENLRESLPLIELDALPRRSVHSCAKRLSRCSVRWLAGTRLASGGAAGQEVWVPYDLVHTDYTAGHGMGLGYFLTSSNGVGAGTTLSAAINHAICELIERDAETLWFHLSPFDRACTEVALETIDSDVANGLMSLARSKGLTVKIYDISSDISVTVMRCEIIGRLDPFADKDFLVVGTSASLCKEASLVGAILEAIQTRITQIVGAREDVAIEEYLSKPSTDTPRFQFKRPGRPVKRSYAEIESCSDFTPKEVQTFLLEQLSAVGCDSVAIVDLTKPGIGIPVCRALVPGLEGSCRNPDYLPGMRAIQARNAD